MSASRISAAAFLFIIAAVSVRAAEKQATGTIESVTLYRGQALVTRVVSLDAPAGAVELVVTELPERVQADSLYASAADQTQVRAVRFRTRVVRQTPREDVREINQHIEAVEKDLRGLAAAQRVLQEQAKYMSNLEQFVAPTVKAELKSGVLNAKTLKDLTEFVFETRRKLTSEALDTNEKERELKETLQLLQAKRQQLTRVRSTTEREAVVFVDKVGAQPAQIRLSYLVSGATWTPAYNLRASGKTDKVEVEYNAIIQQMSGEDWKNVALTLSTASPRLVADPPELAPLMVTLAQRAVQQAQRGKAVEKELKLFRHNVKQAEQQRQLSRDFGGQVDAQWEMNAASGRAQVLELTAPEKRADLAGERASVLSVNYKLEGRTNVSSRSDQQIVRIAELSLPSQLVNVAVPLLTESVYREAHIVNDGKIALLEGQGSVYLDGDFVGRGAVPMVASGQRFVIGFGVDPQLRAWREFVSREEAQQGGNRILTFKYRLVLDNYKEKAVKVRVFDRIPSSQADIKVTLGEPTVPLSDDKEYLRAFRPNGILRWDVDVPAHSAAETAHIIAYSFTLEFDRNMELRSIFSSEQAEKAREQFEEQIMDRRR